MERESNSSPPTPSTPPPPQIEIRTVVEKPGVGEVMLAAFAAMGFAVSARMLLFMSLLGAFALAVMTELSQTTMSAVILGIYCVLVVIPLVALEFSYRTK